MTAGRRVGPGHSRHYALESLEERRLLSASGFVLGPGGIHPVATAMDAAGNVIVMGKFMNEIDFNPRRNRTYMLDGGYDYDNQTYFVAKYSPSGGLAWVV